MIAYLLRLCRRSGDRSWARSGWCVMITQRHASIHILAAFGQARGMWPRLRFYVQHYSNEQRLGIMNDPESSFGDHHWVKSKEKTHSNLRVRVSGKSRIFERCRAFLSVEITRNSQEIQEIEALPFLGLRASTTVTSWTYVGLATKQESMTVCCTLGECGQELYTGASLGDFPKSCLASFWKQHLRR